MCFSVSHIQQSISHLAAEKEKSGKIKLYQLMFSLRLYFLIYNLFNDTKTSAVAH